MKSEVFKKLFSGTPERRLLRLLMAACLALIVAAMGFEYQARDRALGHAEQLSRNLVVSVLDQVEESFQKAEILLGLVQAHLRASGGKLESSADLREYLLQRFHLPSGVQDVHVYDPAGRLVLSFSQHQPHEARAQQQDSFEHHRKGLGDGLHVGRPYRVAPHGSWVFPVSRRLFGPGGAFAGVAVVTLSLQHFNDHFASFDLGPDGLLALNTREGMRLVRYPFVEEALGTDLRNTLLYQQHFSQASSGSFIEVSPIDGIERQYSFGHSRVHPVMAVVGMSKDYVLGDWRQAALRNAFVVGALMLLIVIAGRRTLQALENQRKLARQLQASYRRLADTERALNEHAAVAITDVQGNILAVNEKFCLQSQYGEAELLGRTHRMIRSDRHPDAFFEQMWRTIGQGGVWKGEIENKAKDGSTYWVMATLVPFLDETGQPYQYIALRSDITERKQAEQELERLNGELAKLAAHDELTGLANRRRFAEVLSEEFKRAQRSAAALSVLIFDVDFFKQFNDTYGHPAGDACLKRIASVARSVCRRPADLAARWGGEEFVILLPQTPAAGALGVAERLRAEVEALAIEHRHGVRGIVTISIGVHCIFPEPGDDKSHPLLQCADQALYEAKGAGRNRVVLYRAPAAAGSAPLGLDCAVDRQDAP